MDMHGRGRTQGTEQALGVRHRIVPLASIAIGLTVLFTLACALGKAWPSGQRVTVSEIVLADSAGNQRAILTADQSGRVFLGIGQSPQPAAVLGLLPSNNLSLTIADGKGVARIALGLKETGESGLVLSDENDVVRASLSVTDGVPLLTLCDKSGRPRAGLGVDTDGSPVLSLRDENGKVVWSAPDHRQPPK